MLPENMNTEEVVFLCLARNCERQLPHFFQLLDQLQTCGVSCRAIVGENGSSDRTRELLVAGANHNVTFLDTSQMASATGRLMRMAVGRQLLLQAAKVLPHKPTAICVADLDNVMERPPALRSILRALLLLKNDLSIFGISATSKPVYYDLLSLRAPGYDFSHLNAAIAAAKKHPLTYHRFHKEVIYSAQAAFTSSEPVLCDSTFNGFCLYRADDYFAGSYRGADEADTCEHVTLNLSIVASTSRRMLIAPDLILKAPADHAPVNLLRFWHDRLVTSIKG